MYTPFNESFDAMQKNVFKILSIDGGGFKGLYAATVLEFIEKVNKPIHKHFDLICGTSTGGIIAIGLALGLPATRIKQFYLEHGPKIFPYTSKFSRNLHGLKQIFIKSKYTDKDLRNAFEDVFENKQIRDAKTCLCIPTLNVRNGQIVVIKTSHDKILTRDGDFKMADVALATSAAPTYFPIATIEGFTDGQFVDGGLWANNPSLVGMTEAYRFFVGENKPYDSFSILSIPTILRETGFDATKKPNRSFIDWRNVLFEQIINAQTESVSKILTLVGPHLKEKDVIFEVPSPQVNDSDKKFVEMDYASKKSIKILLGYGERHGHMYNRNPDVVSFFNNEIKKHEFYN